MRSYEAILVLHPRLGADRIEAFLKRIEGKLSSAGAEVERVTRWGLKRLAFTLSKDKKVTDGFYVLINFKGKPGASMELRETLRISEDVLRFSVVRASVTAGVPEEAAGKPVGTVEEKVEISPEMFTADPPGEGKEGVSGFGQS